MKLLKTLIAANEEWLLRRVLTYAKRHGYTAFSSTLQEPWRESICGFSGPMLDILDASDEPMELTCGADYAHEAIARFAVREAKLHRERGVPLGMFLGLGKYYRQAYLDLVTGEGYAPDRLEHYRLFIQRFFDHLEIAFCTEWAVFGDVDLLQEAHTKNRELTNEKNKYLTIVESLCSPVILLDNEGRIANLNHAAASLFNASARTGEGYYSQLYYPLLDRQLDILLQATRKSGNRTLELETVLGTREFEVRAQPLLDVSEKFIGTVVMLSDISDYLNAKRQADAANRAKSTFLATMSHEVRTPITGILGIGRLLKEGPLDAMQAGYVDALISSGEVLQTLVNDVLDYSKFESGEVEVECLPLHLAEMLERVVGLVRASAQDRCVRLALEVDPGLPSRVLGDQGKIGRILLNLVTNAVKYTSAGSVTVSARPSETGVRYAVADTGVGISAEMQARLFEPFIRAASTQPNPASGTGLGLAICKRLAAIIGGEIGFESCEGQGSTFWLEMPLVEAADAPAGPPIPVDAKPVPALRLLLVEDNAVNRLVIEGTLARQGHRVQVVDSGEAALEAVDADRFDLILMDIRMRGIGGLEAIAQIRAHPDPAIAAVPILVLTADLASTEQKSCLDAGADGVLEKPFELSSLSRAMARCLNRNAAFDKADWPPPMPRDDVLDEEVIRQHLQALGAERTQAIVETFHRTTPGLMKKIEYAAEGGDLPRMSTLAHSLKSAAGNVGLMHLRQAAANLEGAAKARRIRGLSQAVEEVRCDFDRSLTALSSATVKALLQT